MSTPAGGVFGQQDVTSGASDYNVIAFAFQMLLQNVQTATLVKVLSCTNDGGVSPVGRVTVQPLVNQMSGNRQATPHGPVTMVYSRISGGANAVIIDPQKGDIGLGAFCSRDISAVVAAAGSANPGSFRAFDWADGVYVGGVPLGIVPTQYVQFSAEGIALVSPVKITLQAPTVAVQGDLTVSGATVGTGEGTFNGIPVSVHVHPGLQLGGSNSPAPIP